ncbi:hypothetical protein [Actinocorallia populi]|uniref:hypothetical protein n=1 Tax=Actinocorallia populi TaxID=2079200 RepID=UPI000D08ECA1|nr:hypothetical protein [Actinocorallia populi]
MDRVTTGGNPMPFVTVMLFGLVSLPLFAVAGYLVRILLNARPWKESECRDAVSAPGRLRITGRAAAGPEGLLVSPLSGTECVWWAVETVIEHETGKEERGNGTVSRGELEASGVPFLVEDRSGTVGLPGSVSWVAGAEPAEERREPHPARPGRTLLRREHVLRAGTYVTVRGTVAPDREGRAAFSATALDVAEHSAAPPLFRIARYAALLAFLGAAPIFFGIWADLS